MTDRFLPVAVEGPIAITGGAGFIGSNLAESFLEEGHEVMVLDNLSRAGVAENISELKGRFGELLDYRNCDVRNWEALREVLSGAGAVIHLAAQTAVTTSIENPRDDFEVNIGGTFNVLEALRRAGRRTPLIFASTNKVYGGLSDIAMVEDEARYEPAEPDIAAHGIGESRPLDFSTPYGCSKGAADQYVLDYAAIYGIPAAVLRMSCVYGPRQFGTEDQGWVAHFLLRALKGQPITIYGNGKQVRDILHVKDCVAAYRTLLADMTEHQGRAYNLGGGAANAVSLREVVAQIEELLGAEIPLRFEDWRAADQPYFVADTRAIEAATGWRASMDWRAGLADLAEWLDIHRINRAAAAAGGMMA